MTSVLDEGSAGPNEPCGGWESREGGGNDKNYDTMHPAVAVSSSSAAVDVSAAEPSG